MGGEPGILNVTVGLSFSHTAPNEISRLGILFPLAASAAEEAAKLRDEDFQLAYAIDLLRGLTVLKPVK